MQYNAIQLNLINILQWDAIECDAMQRKKTKHNKVQWNVMQCNETKRNATQLNSMECVRTQ